MREKKLKPKLVPDSKTQRGYVRKRQNFPPILDKIRIKKTKKREREREEKKGNILSSNLEPQSHGGNYRS